MFLMWDIKSAVFRSLVLLISFCVIVFSSYYINDSRLTNPFLNLLILFVASMLIFINFRDLFMLILGWDGLGIISFFLVVFYQTSSASFSGLLTVLSNRLGDCFLILLITQCVFRLPHSFM